jgi:Spy/CpxP family protein refolding chaperone
MFCSAVIGALQLGQAERGTTRLKGASACFAAVAAGCVAALSSAVSAPADSEAQSSWHCSRYWRSRMIGTR